MALDYNRLTSITRKHVMPYVVHQLKKEMPLFGHFLNMAKKKSAGGVRIEVPVTYAYNTVGGSYSGLEVLSTNQENTRTRAYYDWKQVYQAIVIDNMEQFKNGAASGDVEKVVDLLKQEMEEAKDSIKDKIARMLYGDGTGNGSKDLLGLKALVDDGTDVTTLGGITLGSYSWWQGNVNASVGALTLSTMATYHSLASSGTGKDKVNLIVTTESIYNDYEALLQPSVVYNDPGAGKKVDVLSSGNLYYRGAPVMADEYCNSGEMYMLNDNYIDLMVGTHPDHPTDKSGFTVTPMVAPHDQDGKVGFILFYAQMVQKRTSRHAKLQGIS